MVGRAIGIKDNNGDMIRIGDRVTVQFYFKHSKGVEEVKDFGVVVFRDSEFYVALDRIFALLDDSNKQIRFKMQVRVEDSLNYIIKN